MTGGPNGKDGKEASSERQDELTEEERMRIRLEEHDHVDDIESSESGDDADVAEEAGEGAKVRGEKVTSAEAVLERTKPTDR